MEKVTVNYLLALEKSLRERLSQLNELKTQSARRTIFDNDRREEPVYDLKKVDRKITDINKALFEINHKVKESNARTTVETTINYNSLISEID